MLTKEELPECMVATTVQIIGSKWKLLILRNLLQRPWRFNELNHDCQTSEYEPGDELWESKYIRMSYTGKTAQNQE